MICGVYEAESVSEGAHTRRLQIVTIMRRGERQFARLSPAVRALQADGEAVRVCLLQPEGVSAAMTFVVPVRTMKFFEARTEQLTEVSAHTFPCRERVELWFQLILYMCSLCTQQRAHSDLCSLPIMG